MNFAQMGSPSVSCQGLKTERDPQEEDANPGLRGDRAAPSPALPQLGLLPLCQAVRVANISNIHDV